MITVYGICEICYKAQNSCRYIWLSPKGKDDCTHPGAPIKACHTCRARRVGRYRLYKGKR